LRVDVPELVRAGEAITVRVTPAEPVRQAMRLTVTSEQGTLVEARVLRPSAGPITASIDGLAPGRTASTSAARTRRHRSRR
jgi:hypothetical protein